MNAFSKTLWLVVAIEGLFLPSAGLAEGKEVCFKYNTSDEMIAHLKKGMEESNDK